MQRIFLFIIIFFISAQNGICQQNNSEGQLLILKGTIRDSSNSSPIEAALVSLKDIVANKILRFNTTSKGDFRFANLNPGNYELTVEAVGYSTYSNKHFTIEKNISQNFTIAKSNAMLQAVVITATKQIIENKADRIIYNVDKDITSQSGVATDVLRKIPQVTVDINGNVELLGNPSIKFLINGKPSTVFGNSVSDALQSIPASQIQTIEVISSPGAKYEATGTGGIINIILKKSRQRGFSGLVNLNTGTRQETGSLNLNYKKDNIGISGFFSGSGQLNSLTSINLNRNALDSATGNKYILSQNGNNNFSRFGYRNGVSLDWDLTPKQNISFSFSNFRYANKNNGKVNQLSEGFDKSGNLISYLNNFKNAHTTLDNTNYEIGIDYRKKMKRDREEFSVSTNFSLGNNNTSYFQSSNYLISDSIMGGSTSSNPGKDYMASIAVDYARPIKKNFLLETGLKTAWENYISNSNVFSFSPAAYQFVFDNTQTYNSSFTQKVIAGYISGSFKIGDKLNVIAGLRGEHTFNSATYSKNPNIKIPDYNNIGPALNLSYNFNNNTNIKFSYAYRIERPDYRDLNPFINLADPHNISTGNPYLLPEIGNNYQLAYNQVFGKNNNINLVFIFNHNSPDIKPYTSFYASYKVGDSTFSNVNLTTRGDIATENRLGLNIGASINSIKNFGFRLNLQLYNRTMINDYAVPRENTSFEYRGNLNINYQFSNSLIAEAFGNYNSGFFWQGQRPSFASYTFAFRKQLFHKNGSFGFTATNPFAKNLTQRSTQIGNGFNGTTLLQIPYRSFGISFMYKFGKMKITKIKEEENILTKPISEN